MRVAVLLLLLLSACATQRQNRTDVSPFELSQFLTAEDFWKQIEIGEANIVVVDLKRPGPACQCSIAAGTFSRSGKFQAVRWVANQKPLAEALAAVVPLLKTDAYLRVALVTVRGKSVHFRTKADPEEVSRDLEWIRTCSGEIREFFAKHQGRLLVEAAPFSFYFTMFFPHNERDAIPFD